MSATQNYWQWVLDQQMQGYAVLAQAQASEARLCAFNMKIQHAFTL
jgi:hypothetical protein